MEIRASSIKKYVQEEQYSVVAFVSSGCYWCDQMISPWNKAINSKANSDIAFFEVEDEVGPFKSIDTFPTYVLFNDGKIFSTVEGANILELNRQIKVLQGNKAPKSSASIIEGKIYRITDTKTGKHYVGQTIQEEEKRWQQELKSNQTIGYAMRNRKANIEKTVINTQCKGTYKKQVKDCLDHFERISISEYDSYTNGFNDTRGNRGISAKNGYNYEACLVKESKSIKKMVYVKDKNGTGVYHQKEGHYGAYDTISLKEAESDERRQCSTC